MPANNNSPSPHTVPITVSLTGIKPYATKDALLIKYATNHTTNEEISAVFILDLMCVFIKEYKKIKKIP